MNYDNILFETREGVGKITFNRPSRLNALSDVALQETASCILNANEDKSVNVLIVTGEGKSFSTGRDIESLSGGISNMNVNGPLLSDAVRDVVNAIQSISKVVIAAVNGYYLTGALEIALACDLIIASESAKFGDTHARWGLRSGAGMSQRLPLLVGVLKAREMSFTTKIISAKEAERIGLANIVVPDDKLEETAYEIAHKIMENSLDSVAAYKHLFNAFINNAIQQGLFLETYGILPIRDTIERIDKFKK